MAAKRRRNKLKGKQKSNLFQVDYKTGDLYEYSKLEKEGFVESTNSVGTVSYRRVLNRGLYGKGK
jgi:hypothetical protein